MVVAAGYPGTPSTEVLETLAPMRGVYAEWSPNEKVALDVAIGAAYAGARSMAVMKHVGLNVAADSLFYASMTGMEAGLVIAVADDPGMHSSQGEQDSRRYCQFARVPCLEPSDSQEAKDMVSLGFDLSETFDTPVVIRLTTRISHSHGVVRLGAEREEVDSAKPRSYRVDPPKYVMVPAYARRRHPLMEDRIRRLAEQANELEINRLELGQRSLGIITQGVAYQYTREVFPDASFLRLGMSYPIPDRLVREFARQVDRVIIVEELDPVIEEQVRLHGIACEGKSIFPIVGEFDPQTVRESASKAGLLPDLAGSGGPGALPDLPPRPPVLCPGCPHRGIYAIAHKLKLIVNGDIGCYTLGFLPPLSAVHSTGCMGAGIGQAHGAACAGTADRNIAVIGDSTFFHSGIPALLNLAYNGGKTVVVVLDNRTTAMTGHQDNPGSGLTLQKKATQAVDIASLARALGLQRVHTIDPYDLAQVEEALSTCLAADGPSVIISRRPCALLPEVRKQYRPMAVSESCVACGQCLDLGCPALCLSKAVSPQSGKSQVTIDPLLCTGCGICAQVCPVEAIEVAVLAGATASAGATAAEDAG